MTEEQESIDDNDDNETMQDDVNDGNGTSSRHGDDGEEHEEATPALVVEETEKSDMALNENAATSDNNQNIATTTTKDLSSDDASPTTTSSVKRDEDGGDDVTGGQQEENVIEKDDTVTEEPPQAATTTTETITPDQNISIENRESDDKEKEDTTDEDQAVTTPTITPKGKSENKENDDDEEKEETNDQAATATTMSLDIAYQVLEQVRQANLEMEFGRTVPENVCIPCLRLQQQALEQERIAAAAAAEQEEKDDDNTDGSSSSSTKLQALSNRWATHRRNRAAIRKTKANQTIPAGIPCLACGTPVCKQKHRSGSTNDRWFSKNKSNGPDAKAAAAANAALCICKDKCWPLFLVSDQNALKEILTSSKQMNHLLDVYDRARMILEYSQPFVPEVVTALQGNTSRHNWVGVGTSATGVVAGGLGVAAACTIFTPVGPPLLLASILFGGSATAATAGSEAVNYRCEPTQMANRILTLWQLVQRILHCTNTPPSTTTTTTPKSSGDKDDKPDSGVATENAESLNEEASVIDTAISTESATSASSLTPPPGPIMTATSGGGEQHQTALHSTRTAMNLLKPLTAGALSAISIVTEAREMKLSVDKIRAGNPCDKARQLEEIQSMLTQLPPTDELSKQWKAILQQ